MILLHFLSFIRNENLLCLWDLAMSNRSNWQSSPQNALAGAATYAPRFSISQHTAAVKALAWCPFQKNTLASGGGTADRFTKICRISCTVFLVKIHLHYLCRCIRIWNSSTGVNLKCVDTGSQVCALQWSEGYKELVSSHGFSDNQLCLWNFPTMTKVS
jgi:cell division cycle protein 20 (cofactor of APC complex)